MKKEILIMRVIAGKARHLKLDTIPGDATRPTTDRIKETLFNMIQHQLGDSTFLDLFSGSGAIGIEALSRGAESAVFVEKNPAAVRCIRKNLTFTKLESQAEIHTGDVFDELRRMDGKYRFDYIFMDPPYNHEIERQVLKQLSESELLGEDALIIVEASLETDFSYVEEYGFRIVKKKAYQTNCHVFIEKSEE